MGQFWTRIHVQEVQIKKYSKFQDSPLSNKKKNWCHNHNIFRQKYFLSSRTHHLKTVQVWDFRFKSLVSLDLFGENQGFLRPDKQTVRTSDTDKSNDIILIQSAEY